MASLYEKNLHFLLSLCFFFIPTLSSSLTLSLCNWHSGVQAVHPPPLTSTSDPPPLFDGTTRLIPLHTPKFTSFFHGSFNFSHDHVLIFFTIYWFRLYISYSCPYAQRVWIARNFKVVSSFCPLSRIIYSYIRFQFPWLYFIRLAF